MTIILEGPPERNGVESVDWWIKWSNSQVGIGPLGIRSEVTDFSLVANVSPQSIDHARGWLFNPTVGTH